MAEEFCVVSVPSSGGKGQTFQSEWMPEQQTGSSKGEEKEVLYARLSVKTLLLKLFHQYILDLHL